jgi:hypothetical protein
VAVEAKLAGVGAGAEEAGAGVERGVAVALPGWGEGAEAVDGRRGVDGLVAAVGVVEGAVVLGRGRVSVVGREGVGGRVVDDILLSMTGIGGIAWRGGISWRNGITWRDGISWRRGIAWRGWIAWRDGILIAAPADGIEELGV